MADRAIYELEYEKGVREAFIFDFEVFEEQYQILRDKFGYSRRECDNFTGFFTGHTISRKTIEDRLK